MSQAVHNILYIGHNIQLAETMFRLFAPAAEQVNCSFHHITSVEQTEAALAEKHYTHLICELPFSYSLADKIALDYPLLKTTYITPADIPVNNDLTAVMEGLVSDSVKETLNYLSIPVYFKNKQGQFLACNRYFSHLFGMTPAQVIGKMAGDFLPADMAADIEKIDQEIFKAQQVYFYESQIVDFSGEEREIVIRKERLANSEVQIGMIFDVTEINEARAQLEKERVMLRATADISSDFICFKDRRGRYLGCNKAFEKIVKITEQEIIGKTDEQLFEFKQALISQAQDQEVMASKQTYVCEQYRIDNQGERHFVEIKKVPLEDKQGNVQGTIAIGRDITAQLKIQKRLKIADAAFENAKENLLVTDDQGYILSANKATCTAVGFTKSELLGENISLLACNQRNPIEAALQADLPWQGDITYRVKNGDTHFGWLDVYSLRHPEENVSSRIYTFVDLNQDKSFEEKIQFLSKYDPLTGAFNRIALFNILEGAISRAIHKEVCMAVFLVDINGFNRINDLHGHNAGDLVLRNIANRLKSCVFEKDAIARFGDDEFIIVIDELANEQDVAIVAKKIAAQFERQFKIGNCSEKLSATIGIAMCPDDGVDVDLLIANAECAMQRGKKDKRTSYHFYTEALTELSSQQFAFEEELRQALLHEQVELYYQPQYDLNKKQIVAVEGMLHWNHPQAGVLHPEYFLSLAENSELAKSIGYYVIRQAAQQAVIWHKLGVNFGRIAINISEAQLSQEDFIAHLQHILVATKCSNKWLEFEIDEIIFRSDCTVVYDNLLNIAKIGIALTIANFAEDRPILYLFEQLGIEKFKLSKCYAESTSTNVAGTAMKDAVFVFARSLGLDVVGDTLGNLTEASFSNYNKFESGGKWLENKAMKASEAAFYLRCNKRK